MRRSIALVSALVLASGCSLSSSEQRADQQPPEPELREFLHDNYTVVSQTRAQLVEDEPEAVVVVSKGPGLTPGAPVPGGTGDVQVLAYDDQAKRWVLAFDAADQLAPIGYADSATPVLDQSHPIEDVTAQLVRFEGRNAADLLVSGLDAYSNHPSTDVAIIRFGRGTADLAWTSDEVGARTPVVTGEAEAQTVLVEASYYTAWDAMCCPVRQYNRTVGVDEDGNVVVVDDDRPYLGAYLTPLDPPSAGAVVLGVEKGSPADGVLEPGDRVLAINGETAPEDGADLELPLLKVLGQEKAWENISIRLQRAGTVRTLTARLASIVSAPAETPGAGQLGIQVAPENAFEITDIAPTSPAETAGLTVGDRIVTVNHRPIKEMLDFYIALWQSAGTPVPVTYIDGSGTSRTVQVAPEQMNDGPTTGRL